MVEWSDMKNCLKNFWVDFKNAIYGADYKNHFAGKKFSEAFKYLFKLTLIEAIILILVMSVFFIPAIKFILDKENIVSFIDTHIPQGASVEIKDGIVTTGDGKPIYIEGTEDMKKEGFDYLIVVDPTINTSENILEVFKTYKTVNLVTSNQSLVVDNQGSVSVKSLEGYPNYVITKEAALDMYDKARPYIMTFVPILFFLGFILAIAFGLAMSFVLVFVIAFGIMYISQVKKINLTYKQSYIVGIYSITVSYVASVLAFIITGKPLMFLWILVIAIAASVYNLRNK